MTTYQISLLKTLVILKLHSVLQGRFGKRYLILKEPKNSNITIKKLLFEYGQYSNFYWTHDIVKFSNKFQTVIVYSVFMYIFSRFPEKTDWKKFFN
jgi:hypothetical protein